MIVWLKFIHVAAIAVWSAGLIVIPGLLRQRANVLGEDELFRLQGFVRFAYVVLLSPAAFIAVASGTALIFLRETYFSWFSLKLAFVAALVALHVLAGRLTLRVFRTGGSLPAWLFAGEVIATLAVVSAILALVLGKPELPSSFLPDVLHEPGGLRRILGPLIPSATP